MGTGWLDGIRRNVGLGLALLLAIALIGCAGSSPATDSGEGFSLGGLLNPDPLEEVSPPEVLQSLRPALDRRVPRVKILDPQPNETLPEQSATVRFRVDDLTTFKDSALGMGPHLHVFLDDQPYKAVYDFKQPLTLTDLAPGTHTLRAFASRPWHESFKNPEAYDQVSFNILAPSRNNQIDPKLPLLTYSRPEGEYGGEPILLDYYLTQASRDTTVKVTVNGESFTTQNWEPIYLKGFKEGQNLIKLELLNGKGQPIQNAFSETLRVIHLKSGGQDPLARLMRGEFTAAAAQRIVDYDLSQALTAQEETATTAARAPKPVPTPTPVNVPAPQPDAMGAASRPSAALQGSPEVMPSSPPTPAGSVEPQSGSAPVLEKQSPAKPESLGQGSNLFKNRFKSGAVPSQPKRSQAVELPAQDQNPAVQSTEAEALRPAKPSATQPQQPTVPAQPAPQPKVEQAEKPEGDRPSVQEPEVSASAPPERAEPPESKSLKSFFNRFRQPDVLPQPETKPALPDDIPASVAVEEPEGTAATPTPFAKTQSPPASSSSQTDTPALPDLETLLNPPPINPDQLPIIRAEKRPNLPSRFLKSQTEPTTAPTPETEPDNPE